MIWKMIHRRRPLHLARILEMSEDLKIIFTEPRLQFTARTFRQRSSKDWNDLPETLRRTDSIAKLKKN